MDCATRALAQLFYKDIATNPSGDLLHRETVESDGFLAFSVAPATDPRDPVRFPKESQAESAQRPALYTAHVMVQTSALGREYAHASRSTPDRGRNVDRYQSVWMRIFCAVARLHGAQL